MSINSYEVVQSPGDLTKLGTAKTAPGILYLLAFFYMYLEGAKK